MILNLAVEYEKMVDPRLPACSRQAGRLVETSCTILDVAGVSVFRPGKIYEYVSQTSTMSNSNYPERMGKMYIINVGTLHRAAWRFIKGFLDPVTASKISVLTSYEYKAELLKQIPAENLPVAFGGACQCEGGCELSDAGPWQEEEWKRPAWWQKEPTDATIENKSTEVQTTNDATTDGETLVVEEDKVETGNDAVTESKVPVAEAAKVAA